MKVSEKSAEIEVNINVGYMKLDGDRNLKKCSGKTLPIKVSSLARKVEKAI